MLGQKGTGICWLINAITARYDVTCIVYVQCLLILTNKDWLSCGFCPTSHKTGHFGDISRSQSVGLLWKKTKPNTKKHAFTNQKKCTSTHTHPFNVPLSGTTQVSQYQKGKTNLDFTEARDSEWQWHQLGHMQVCTSLQTDNHASTPPLCFFTGRMPFLPPNQQCQSTEGNTTTQNKHNKVKPV